MRSSICATTLELLATQLKLTDHEAPGLWHLQAEKDIVIQILSIELLHLCAALHRLPRGVAP